jgi:hypothetical protein
VLPESLSVMALGSMDGGYKSWMKLRPAPTELKQKKMFDAAGPAGSEAQFVEDWLGEAAAGPLKS